MKTTWNFRQHHVIALSVAVFSAVPGCAGQSDILVMKSDMSETKDAESDDLVLLQNDDVSWSGTYLGIAPVLSGSAARVLKQIASEYQTGRKVTRKRLVALLTDPRRFVVAHVLLTNSGYDRKFEIDGSSWNNLTMYLNRDGSVRIDPDQRARIETKWKTEMSTQ